VSLADTEGQARRDGGDRGLFSTAAPSQMVRREFAGRPFTIFAVFGGRMDHQGCAPHGAP
jgi:hypothetical protein